MEHLFREPTEDTPLVELNLQDGFLHMEGKCIPENAQAFFEPIHQLLDTHLNLSSMRMKVRLKLDYFSTSSSKHLLHLLRLLEHKVDRHGVAVTVEWHYKDGDDDLKESGEDYASLTSLPFTLVVV